RLHGDGHAADRIYCLARLWLFRRRRMVIVTMIVMIMVSLMLAIRDVLPFHSTSPATPHTL
ncbi:hypothetical protein SAMN05444340_117107, partial [Citreimonas salinaria]